MLMDHILIGSVKTAMIKLFDKRYVVIIEDVAVATVTVVNVVGLQGRGITQYQEFSNMNSLEFNGVKDPIITIR